MAKTSFVSEKSVRLIGKPIAGSLVRKSKVPGFDQAALSSAHVLCIGAGGIVSHIAPTLVRKGVGRISLYDHDVVEVSNLSRQHFYEKDIGKNKALALAMNLYDECTAETSVEGYNMTLEQAIEEDADLSCDVAICGVDNNPARVAATRHFRCLGIPVIFAAVSADADHGYVFVQGPEDPCLACVFPDMVNDDRFPCPGTPAVADILQAVGAMAVYAVDSLLMDRSRLWNYRTVRLSDGQMDSSVVAPSRSECLMFAPPE